MEAVLQTLVGVSCFYRAERVASVAEESCRARHARFRIGKGLGGNPLKEASVISADCFGAHLVR